MQMGLLVLGLIASFGIWSYTTVSAGMDHAKHDLALDLIEGCIDTEGAVRQCSITYDVEGSYVEIKVGDKMVYCRDGRVKTC